MSEKNKSQKPLTKTSQEKTELAQKIAANSQRISKTYASLENAFVYSLRWISSILNRILNTNLISKLFALAVAVVLYIVVNVSSEEISGISQSSTITDVPVQVVYNSEAYEISGIPEAVDLIISGDMSDITVQKNKSNAKVTADLTGLTEGTYQIKLMPTNFSNKLEVNILDYSMVDVTIKKKTTEVFTLTSEFINTNKIDAKHKVVFSDEGMNTTSAIVRASQDTIDRIAFVKALFDVSGITATCTKEATLVAFDHQGQAIDCDIFTSGSAVSAELNYVEAPHRTVNILVKVNGNLPNGQAINSILLSKSNVIIYGDDQEKIDSIEAIYITLDANDITADKEVIATLTKPAGVNDMDVSKVTMNIDIEPITEREINGVGLRYVGLNSALDFKFADNNSTSISVVVSGTQANIAEITAANISAYLDFSAITTVGTYELPIIIKTVGSDGSSEINYVKASTSGSEKISVTFVAK